MNQQTPSMAQLETQVVDRVLAKMYLDLAAEVGPQQLRARTKRTLDRADERFGIERPSVPEIERAIRGRLERGQGLEGALFRHVMAELAAFYRQELQGVVERAFDAVVSELDLALSDLQRRQLLDTVVIEIVGYGPLEPILADPSVTAVMIDGPDTIYVERDGKLKDTPARFRDSEALISCIHRILMPTGARLDERNPMVDVGLPDGSRVNVVMPPIAHAGPTVTIQKLTTTSMTFKDLIEFGSMSPEIVAFLRACVLAKLNIAIAGGPASGKTTMLNMMTSLIPVDERVVTVEQTSEMQISDAFEHLVRLESRRPDAEGIGEVTMRDLFENALRMRADRIVCCEVQGGEALDILRAANMGQDGIMFSMFANGGLRDALARLETMATLSDLSAPLLTIRRLIATGLDVIVYQERLKDGSRKILNVAEVAGLEGDVIVLNEIFEFRRCGEREGRIAGYHVATGAIPDCLTRFREAGIDLSTEIFAPSAA
jgi:pilus assembly protein CpaF